MTEPVVRPNKNSLSKVGVELVNFDRLELRCMVCGQVWSPNAQPGGRLPDGWWKCKADATHSEQWAQFVLKAFFGD